MKKREVLLTLATMAVLGLSGCGTKELTLVSDQVQVELGAELDQAVTAYVQLDEKDAADAVVDLSAVDVSKVGTYDASVTYNDQTVTFEIVVSDTTAPEVEIADGVVVAVDTPLTAEKVITGITELSGSVDISFADLEIPEEENTVEGTEAVEENEAVEETEAPEETDLEAVEETEVVEDATEQMESPAVEFTLNDVLCTNDYLIFTNAGEYDVMITVADASGNSTEVAVHVLVGEAPEFSGIDDIAINVGEDEIDYLDGVTATDYNGNDITDKIVCDSAAVDLENPGEYTITYTVADERGFEATETAIVTVKDKSGRTSTSSTSGSKPGTSTSGSSTSGATSSTFASTSSNTSGSGSSDTSSGASDSTSTSGSSNTSESASSASGATSSTSTSTSSTTTDSSNQASADTTTTTPDTSNQTTTQTPSADTTTTTNPWDAPMTVPDDVEFASPDDPLYDNTGTGGTDGGDVIGGGNW